MYLIPSDYNLLIQSGTLDEAIGSNPNILTTAELVAIEEATGYLKRKYDVTLEFSDTPVWSPSAVYTGGSRVYLDAAPFNQTLAYAINALVLYTDGNVYIFTTAQAANTVWTPANVKLIGPEFSLFYGTYPHPTFDFKNIYSIGNMVFWKGNNYTAVRGTIGVDHDSQIQINQAQLPCYFNYAPDDPIYGVTFWGKPTAYTITAGTLPTNTASWTAGDNRSQLLVLRIVDIMLYHIHTRVAPNNIPLHRIQRYMGLDSEIKLGPDGALFPTSSALGWLQSLQRGNNDSILPAIQPVPRSAKRIRWGSDQLQGNDYL